MPQRRSPLTLQPADPDELPLAFAMGEHLSGRREPFRDTDTGKRSAGRILSRTLSEFPIGVVVTVSGLYRPPDSDVGDLDEWSESSQQFGTLDAGQLGTLCHAFARRVASRGGAGNTPAELYTLEVTVEPIQPAKPQQLPLPFRPRKPTIFRQHVVIQGRKQAVYRDKKTGRFAPRATWKDQRK